MVLYFLNTRFFDWVPSYSDRVERLPVFGNIDYSLNTGYLLRYLYIWSIRIIAVQGLRQSRTEACCSLLALRDNEQGVGAFGVSVTPRQTHGILEIAGFLCGMRRGGIACSSSSKLSYSAYQKRCQESGSSIRVFIAAIVGGIGSSPTRRNDRV